MYHLDAQASIIVQRGSFKVPENNHLRFTQINDLIFGHNAEINLSRRDLFRLQNIMVTRLRVGNDDVQALDRFILSVLYWGFPNNRHGKYNDIYERFGDIEAFMQSVFSCIVVDEHITRQRLLDLLSMIRRHNLGVSAYSKLLYFSGFNVEGNTCLILDSFVVKGIVKLNNLHDHFINELATCTHSYIRYLQEMRNLAEILHVNPDEIEYALWLKGRE